MHCGDQWGTLVIDRGHPGGSAERSWRHSSAEETLPKNIESIELKDLPGTANDVIGTIGDVKAAFKTIEDPPMDTAWVTQAIRELAGVGEAMTKVRDELANNQAKLSDAKDRRSEVKKHIAGECQKLTETDDPEIQQEIRDRIKKLEGSNLGLEI